MPELVGVVEEIVIRYQLNQNPTLSKSKDRMGHPLLVTKTPTQAANGRPLEWGTRLPYRRGMSRVVVVAVWMCALAGSVIAQEAGQSSAAAKGTTIIGCLAGPDADDHYTLTSMQHRVGVDVVGGDELKQGAGAKVKLTGAWEPLPGGTGKTSDATRRFKVTQMTVLEGKCSTPQAVTPVSKSKQQQQQQKQEQQK